MSKTEFGTFERTSESTTMSLTVVHPPAQQGSGSSNTADTATASTKPLSLTSSDRKASGARMDKAITVWGWAFDVFLILVNLTDVVSDCLIARQFWVDGHTVFFWLVISSLMIASIVYAIVGVEFLLRDRLSSSRSRLLQYPLMLVFAQFVPVMNWVLECVKPTPIGSQEVAQWSTTLERSDFATGIAAEEIGAMAGASHVMARMDAALARHLRSHALFYVESIVEAIPQSIVQLVAVSYLGEASSLQVFSLALSMVSIISKGYVLSRAFAIPEMVFKFFIGAHDVFSLFYIFATVLSNMSSRDVDVGGGVFVDYMSAVWVLKLAVCWGYVALVALGVLGYVVVYQPWDARSFTGKNIGRAVGVFALGVLLFAPVVIALEGMKLLWINFAIMISEPVNERFPPMAMWYSFCNSGSTSFEYKERFRYVCLRLIDELYSEEAVMARKRPSLRRRAARKAAANPRNTDAPHNQVEEVASRHNDLRDLQQSTWLVKRNRPLRRLDANATPPFINRVLPSLTAKGSLRPLDLIRAQHELKDLGTMPSKRVEQAFLAVVSFGLLIFTVGQLYSLLFPFLHFIINHGHQNLLQDFCFYGTAATLFVVVCLAPRAFRYCTFMAMAHVFYKSVLRSNSTSLIEKFIEDYYLPPPALFIAKEVDPVLLPTDLVGIVASFLRREDLDLKDVTIQQCEDVKAQMMDTMRFECHDDDKDAACVSVDVATTRNDAHTSEHVPNAGASSTDQVLLPPGRRLQSN